MKSNGDFSIGSNVWTGTSKLIEEMGEAQQVLGKLIGSHGVVEHYDGSNLRDRLVEELGDLLSAIHFFRHMNLTEEENKAIAARLDLKMALYHKWHQEGK